MGRKTLFFGFLLASGIGLAASCGDSEDTSGSGEAPGCNDDPFSCPDGQTCWLVGTSQSDLKFACSNSGSKQVGDACKPIVGQPDCGDDLTCLALDGVSGVCTPFCSITDASHKCPEGQACVQVMNQNTGKLYAACKPPEDGTGGAGGQGGAGGAGGAATGGEGGSGGGAGGAGGGA